MIYQNKLIIWLWKSARYEVNHPYLSSELLTRVQKWRYIFITYTYIKCILVSKMVIWLGSRRITSHEMENAEKSIKIDLIRPVNLQEEMTLRQISDETERRIGSNAQMGFLPYDIDLRHTSMNVRCQEIWNRWTESVQRQPVMTYVAQISTMFMNWKMLSNLWSMSYQVNQLCLRFQNFVFK